MNALLAQRLLEKRGDVPFAFYLATCLNPITLGEWLDSLEKHFDTPKLAREYLLAQSGGVFTPLFEDFANWVYTTLFLALSSPEMGQGEEKEKHEDGK